MAALDRFDCIGLFYTHTHTHTQTHTHAPVRACLHEHKIGVDKIERVSTFKYLGVLLDEYLSFNDHVDYVVTKASKKLGILRKSREYLDRKTSVLLYKSLVLPHMDYCSLIYTNTNEGNLNRLQLVQNAACRAILQADNRAHINYMHQELSLPTIRERLEFQLSMECFKQINVPNNSLSNMFTKKETGRNTRTSNTNMMIVPKVRTNMGRNAFSFKGPDHWNRLSTNTRTITDKTEFRTSISKVNNRDVDHPT